MNLLNENTLTLESAKQVFDFIANNLSVINDTPYVEAMMIELEEYILREEG